MKQTLLMIILWSFSWMLMGVVGDALIDNYNYWSHVLAGIYTLLSYFLICDLTKSKEEQK